MIQRKFMFRGIELPEIDPSMSAAEHQEVYANDYPELLNAAIVYHDPVDGVQEYTFAEKTAPAKVTEAPAGQPKQSQTVEFKTSVGRKG